MSLHLRGVAVLATLAMATPSLGQAPPSDSEQPAAQVEAGADVQAEAGLEHLASGPMHEAFARPVGLTPEPGPLVKKEPPQPLEEIVPEAKPDIAGVEWIPGYWDIDPALDDFVWVSGVWRKPPPGHQWVAGYWVKVEDGYRRVPGAWPKSDLADMEYLPQPPESQEAGPSSPAPGPNYFWVPGQWQWRDGRYAWRPGYWWERQENWVYHPACYYWTPRGYVYVNHYWDHPLESRGVLFAPVRFTRPVYRDRGFSYSPSYVLSLGTLHFHLFTSTRYNGYYYGDYYAYARRNNTLQPWFAYHRQRGGYDPLFVYSTHRYGRSDRDWANRLEKHYQTVLSSEDRRPARTVRSLARVADGDAVRTAIRAVRLADVVSGNTDRFDGRRFRRLDRSDRDRVQQTVGEFRKWNQGRAEAAAEARAKLRARVKDGDIRADVRGDALLDPNVFKADRDRFNRSPLSRINRPNRPDRDSVDRDRPDVRRPDRPDVRRPDRPDVRRPDRPDVRRPDRPDVRKPDRPERPNIRRPDRPDVRKPDRPKRPNIRRPERPDVRKSDRADAPKPSDRPKVDLDRNKSPGSPTINRERPAPRIDRRSGGNDSAAPNRPIRRPQPPVRGEASGGAKVKTPAASGGGGAKIKIGKPEKKSKDD